MIYLLSLSYLSVNLVLRSHANSESATMTSRKLISSMSKSTSESASMTSRKLISSMSKSTSESASMTLFVNAMIYLPSSSYLSVNLILRSRANSEPATMASRKLISSMSKSTSESASMTFFVNAMIYLFSSLDLSVNRSTSRSRATSEPASMITLSHIVSLLQ